MDNCFMMKRWALVTLLTLGAAPVWGQSQTGPAHTVPIFRGPGVTGFTAVGPGTNGQLLLGQTSADPAYHALSGDVTSVTAAGVLTLGKVNGVTFPASGTSGGIPYYSSSSSILSSGALGVNQLVVGGGAGVAPSGVATGNSGVLVTSAGGVPSISSTLPSALSIPSPAFSGTATGSNAIPNGVLATAGAATLKGNPTVSSAAVQDFTIQGLTDIAAPSGTADWIPIYQASTGIIKKTNASELVSVSGVSSLDQRAAPEYSSTQAQTGAINLGGGLSLGQQFNFPQITPWNPVVNNNTLVQTTGVANALRNASFTSWNITRFMNKDSQTLTYNIGIASFTASIATGCSSFTTSPCSTMTVTGSPTGTLNLFQRVTDVTNFTTNAVTASGGTVLNFASTTGIATGMYVNDVTNPSAIPGNLTVSSLTGTTVTLSGAVGSPTLPVASYTYDSGTGLVTLTITSPTSTHSGTNPLPLSAGQTVTIASLNIAGLNGTYALASATNTASGWTITYTGPTAQAGSPSGGGTLRATVGSGDTLAFRSIARGTSIIGLGTGTGGAGTYYLSNSQTVSSETMQSAGGWSADGVYVIPVGSAGASLTCTVAVPSSGTAATGNFTPNGGIGCQTNSALTDIIFRLPLDYVDASRITCELNQGPIGACVSTNTQIQPVTFQIYINYDTGTIATPSLDTKIPCPVVSGGCADTWTNATTDVPLTSGYQCGSLATPLQCVEAWTWVPQGIRGGYEVNFHTGAVGSGKSITISGFELKQTPGALCSDTTHSALVMPCFQFNPGPLEIPDVVADINRNKRFTQLIGNGLENSFPSSRAAVETTAAFATSTTHVLSTWTLPVTMRCNTWALGAKSSASCPMPRVYYNWASVPGIGDYAFIPAGGVALPATAIAVNWAGLNSIQFDSTVSGATAGAPGYIQLGKANDATSSSFIMLDSSIIGD